MFKLDPNPTFLAEVPITRPGDQAPQLLKVHFKHMTSSQLNEFTSGNAGRTNEEVLARMVDHVDPCEKPGDLSDAEFWRALLENYPAASGDLLRVYLRELTESRVKNS